MKESIYACVFSSGLIKVGKSIDPVSRMAAHADRVACTGIEIIETHHAVVLGCIFASERELIKRCEESSSKKHKYEWFDGLDFAVVTSWIDEISSANLQTTGESEDSQIIDAIGGTAKVAELCDVTPGAVSQWRNNGIPKTTLKFLRLAKPKVFSFDKRKAA